MKKLLILPLSVLLLTSPALVLAKSDEDHSSNRQNSAVVLPTQSSQSNLDLKIKINTNNNSSKPESRGSDQSEDAKEKDETDGNSFEIRGLVEATGSAQLTINSKVIKIDPTKTGKYQQKGDLVVGAFAKVEGKIINAIMYATEIKIEAQGKFGHPPARINIDLDDDHGHISTIAASPIATQSASPSASPASPSAQVNIRARISGPIDQVVNILENLLKFLKSIL